MISINLMVSILSYFFAQNTAYITNQVYKKYIQLEKKKEIYSIRYYETDKHMKNTSST